MKRKTPTSSGTRRAGLAFGSAAMALFLAGCASVATQPLTAAEVQTQAQRDRLESQRGVEPIPAVMSLEEAIARGLKYNLERRTRMMEEAIAFRQFEASRYDMLPKLVASAGYSSRSEFATTRAVDSVTGKPSLANPFISSDKSHGTVDLGLSWNVLDFGLSYYGARQNADRALIAVERRRKAMHNLIQDVRTAFWRAASAQKLRKEVKAVIALAEDGLADSRKAENERLRSPIDALRYQRQLLENLRLLETIEQELSTARLELANLINAPLAVELKVAEPAQGLSARILSVPLDTMEEVAIAGNADLREQFYNTRIATEETRKILLRMFPGLSLGYSIKRNDDQYLIHNQWNEAGAQLSLNLLNLFSLPTQSRLAEAGVALADQRRMAAQMAVLAQVHIARLHFSNALQQYQRSADIAAVDERLEGHMANRELASASSKLDRVSSRTAAIVSQLRSYQAQAQAHAAASKLQASLGMEPDIGSVQDMSLPELQAIVGRAITKWENGELAAPAAPKREAQP